jgi:hypothetical protein
LYYFDPNGNEATATWGAVSGAAEAAGASTAGAATAGAIGAGIVIGIWPTPAGEGSDIPQPFPIPDNIEQCPEKKECDPPKGTVCYIIDRVPPSKPHYPIDGSHYHLWKMNQAPNGDCFWNKIGASRTAPPGAIPCSFSRPPR